MLNQVVMVGRLAQDLEVKELENGEKEAIITLAIPRSFKNEEGVYETDFVSCILLGQVATNTSEYCKKGDMIGIKGRLESRVYEDSDGNKKKRMEVIADRVTFLSSAKQKEAEPEMA